MSEPDVVIEQILMTKVKEFTTLPLVFENVAEAQSQADLNAWVEVTHFRNGNVPYALSGDGDTQQLGMLQLAVHVKRASGVVEARHYAAELVKLFWTPANLLLSSGGLRVRVAKRPVLGTGVPTDASYVIPVSVYYEVFV